VALLMAMTAPVIRRIAVRPRVLAVAMLLGSFVVLTRGEPSVLRAVTMALAVEVARSGGQQVRSVRVLGMTVAVLLIIDPLLVWSVAFQLSVAATAGIAVGASPLAARLPGPRYMTNLLAMGICAQLAVAPLAVLHFGHVPITGVVANLLVAPVVGVVMGWGLTAGVLTGITGIASNVVHLPTLILGGWLVSVAGWFARLPIGYARPVHVAAVATAVVLMMVAGKRGWPAVRRLGAMVVVAALVAAALVPHGPSPGRHGVAVGAEVLVGSERAVVVVDGRAEIASVLSGLRTMGVVRVAAVVSRTGSAGAVGTATQVCQRLGPCTVLMPPSAAGALATSGGDTSPGIGVVSGQRSVPLGGSQSVVISVDGDRLGVAMAAPTDGAFG
jgi:competence protein ComEC